MLTLPNALTATAVPKALRLTSEEALTAKLLDCASHVQAWPWEGEAVALLVGVGTKVEEGEPDGVCEGVVEGEGDMSQGTGEAVAPVRVCTVIIARDGSATIRMPPSGLTAALLPV
jgi:hypothetical protein